MRLMKQIRFLLLLLITLMGATSVKAQFLGNLWQYEAFDEWSTHGDSVIGKYDENNGYFFAISKDFIVTINEKDYYAMTQYPMPHTINGMSGDKRETSDPPHERQRYSIGVRFENGRVLTDCEDFKYYQSCHLIYDDYRIFLFSHGDPTYLPYNLTADSTELILYDYTMEVGDSYRHVDGHEDIFVVKKDTVEIYGKPAVPLRRLTLSNGLVLIEGIGCINSNGMLIDYLNPEPQYTSRYTYLSACTDYNRSVYDYVQDCGVSIIDSATLGVSSTIRIPQSSETCIYDLQGRRLKGEPKRGIYIKDGKIVLVGDKR